MELTRIRSFVVLAERLHFGETSRLLNLSQPALSKQIRQLEEEIGAPLLERGRHGAKLTEVGRIFAEEARSLVKQADAALEQGRRAARGEIGKLSIGFGFSTVTLVPRVISEFRKLHPSVEVELRDMSTANQLEALRRGRIDVGFARLPIGGKLRRRLVLEDQLVLAFPSSMKVSDFPQDLSSLKDAPFIMMPRSRSPDMYDRVMRVCAKYGFSPHVAQEANEFPTILALIAAGLGVALLPQSQLRTRIESLEIQSIPDKVARWQVGAVWSKGSGSPLIRDFIELVTKELRCVPTPPRLEAGAR